MTQIRITNLVGQTPISVYVADVYGNNKTFIGTITDIPTTMIYEYPPSLFDGAPSIMLILQDANGTEKFQILDGVTGCTFNVYFEMVGCTTNMIINPE
jgi:hypothetical protein